jgi:hypothetical protein
MKLKNEKSFIRSIVVCLVIGTTLILSTETSLCQDQRILKFNDCKNYEDTCLYIGQMFIDNQSEKKFEDLAYLFADNILFRALIPSSLVTSNKPSEAAKNFHKWFNTEDPGRYEVLDFNTEVMVDCLHIYYKIFRTYKDNSYNVEQHLYCEVEAGKIQKLSLLCSGFRKVN